MRSQLDRFMAKIDYRSPSGCWAWTGATSDTGYGNGRWDKRSRLAHRLMFELYYGPIPDGLQLDHLCRNHACVNPEHLEPVTPRENAFRGEAPPIKIARSGRCSRGHEMTPENTRIRQDRKQPVCIACANLRNHERKASSDYQPRQATCKRGHPLGGENARVTTSGYVTCKQCHRDINRVSERLRYARKKAAKAGGA